jgi:hypothetical protein
MPALNTRSARMWLWRALSLAITLILAWQAVRAAAPEAKRAFTVADSIELEKFVEPETALGSEVGLFSPDGSQFVVVTQRGVLASNRLRATLWLFETGPVDGAAAAGEPRLPRRLAELEGSTHPADNNVALRAVRLLSWSDDGRELRFLARLGGAEWRLCRVDVATGMIQPMTPEGQNVGYYTQRGGLIAYTVAPNPGATEPEAVVVGTGRSLGSLLFPAEDLPDAATMEGLWLLSAGHSRQVIDPDTHRAVLVHYNIHDPSGSGVSLSPDGRFAVVSQTVTAIPPAWEKYTPKLAAWRMVAATGEQLSHQRLVPEQFILVELQSGRASSMFGAPLGRSAAWFKAPTRTLWSKDSRNVLVTNTFVPFHGRESLDDRHRRDFTVPQIVTYDVDSRRWLDVAPVEAMTPESALRHSSGISWESDVAERTLAGEATRPRIVVQQGLNEAPALFVSDDSGTPRELWNPNPQLAGFSLGTAERYHWLDRHGRSVAGVLFKPPGYQEGRRYPLVIEARSYFQDRFVVDGTYATAVAARAMAASGMMVLQAGEPQLPADTGAGARVAASLEAYQAAIDQLSAAGVVDPTRVGLIGFSRTCFNVMYALTKDPTRFAAATIANGMVYGFIQYFGFLDENANSLGSEQYRELYGGSPFGVALGGYLADSPVFSLDKVTAAVRVETHSPADLLFDWETYGGLRAQHKPVDLIMLPHASHVVSMPADVLQSQEGDLEWFRFWLQGYESSSPASPGQYRRWEALCDLTRSTNAGRSAPCVPSSR